MVALSMLHNSLQNTDENCGPQSGTTSTARPNSNHERQNKLRMSWALSLSDGSLGNVMKLVIFLKWSTTQGISVFSPVVGRPVTKSRGSWRMDVGEMVETEGVPLGLDELVLMQTWQALTKSRLSSFKVTYKKHWRTSRVRWTPGWQVSF